MVSRLHFLVYRFGVISHDPVHDIGTEPFKELIWAKAVFDPIVIIMVRILYNLFKLSFSSFYFVPPVDSSVTDPVHLIFLKLLWALLLLTNTLFIIILVLKLIILELPRDDIAIHKVEAPV